MQHTHARALRSSAHACWCRFHVHYSYIQHASSNRINTIVQTNKIWIVQQVEDMTGNTCSAKQEVEHTHKSHLGAPSHKHMFCEHCMYARLVPHQRTNNSLHNQTSKINFDDSSENIKSSASFEIHCRAVLLPAAALRDTHQRRPRMLLLARLGTCPQHTKTLQRTSISTTCPRLLVDATVRNAKEF